MTEEVTAQGAQGTEEGTTIIFSIEGCDLATGDLGIAVSPEFLAVGAVLPWACGGVGAVATQAWQTRRAEHRAQEIATPHPSCVFVR